MKTKYRIVERRRVNTNMREFVIQQKFLGFWWDYDARYSFLDSAQVKLQDIIEMKNRKDTETVVFETEV